jgi:hypothetical protein
MKEPKSIADQFRELKKLRIRVSRAEAARKAKDDGRSKDRFGQKKPVGRRQEN